jgi:hypothetical protein
MPVKPGAWIPVGLKHAVVYQFLAGVYGWFTEGFATADLQDAMALLDAL